MVQTWAELLEAWLALTIGFKRSIKTYHGVVMVFNPG